MQMYRAHTTGVALALLTLACLPWTTVALAGQAQAAAPKDITGAWIVTVDSPQGRMDIDATFKQAGEKITGEVTSPMGSVDFAGTLIKNDLSISYSIPLQGQTLEIKMTGAVENDAMSGALDFGGMGQAQWTAKRKPAGAAAPVAAVTASPAAGASRAAGVSGKWNITVQMGGNAMPLTGMFEQDGETVTGSIATPVGDLPVTGTMVGNSLKLQFTAQTPQGDMAVTMTGELGPEGLSGKSSVPGLGESDWSAKRAD